MRTIHQIRPATAADETAVRACAAAAYAQYIPAIGRKPAPMVADFATLIAAGHVHVCVDAADTLQGFIVFYADGDAVLLENVAVHPSATGAGLGKRLIAFCEKTARADGAKAVRLYTNAKMHANRALYPRLGYRETGRKTEDGFDRVYFAKDL